MKTKKQSHHANVVVIFSISLFASEAQGKGDVYTLCQGMESASKELERKLKGQFFYVDKTTANFYLSVTVTSTVAQMRIK